MPNDEILDFNEIICHLPLTDDLKETFKNHKWCLFNRKHFMQYPVDIKCINCNSHFAVTYHRMVDKKNILSCDEVQI